MIKLIINELLLGGTAVMMNKLISIKEQLLDVCDYSQMPQELYSIRHLQLISKCTWNTLRRGCLKTILSLSGEGIPVKQWAPKCPK